MNYAGDLKQKYRCRILFTTRSRYENRISLEVKARSVEFMAALMGKSYAVEKKIDITEQIIELLRGHTFAVTDAFAG